MTAVLLLLPLTAAADLFKADEFTLDNGLRVVVVENHKAPLIKHMVWYNAGSVDEVKGKGGSAHLLEHLMFRGTKKVKGDEFNQIMHENGADSNAFTSQDMTAYHQFADISKLEALMALEADRMQNLNFDEDAFEAERKIVYQERKQVIENNPAAPFAERLSLLLWGNSAYGRPVSGLADEIMDLNSQDIRDFYQRYYAPNNAILVLAGDIDVPTAKKLAEKYYGNIPARNVAKKNIEPETDSYREKLQMKLPLISTPKLVEKYRLPNYSAVKGSVYDYIVLAEYLGGSQTSALYQELVENRKIAVGVSAGYSFNAQSNSVFFLSLLPAEDVTIMAARIALREARAQALQDLTVAKLEKVKKKMIADLVFANDNPEDAAYWLGSMLISGFSLSEAQNYENEIKNVTLEGVIQAAKEVFLHSSALEGVLLPLPEGAEKND